MSENSNPKQAPASPPEEESKANATISGPEDASADQGSDSSSEDLAAQNAQLQDRLLRTQAEMANAVKRGQEESKRAVMHASEQFVRHFLEVADNLERALASRAETDAKAIIEGVALTLNGLQATFTSLGIETIEPDAGTKPDPHQHQTIMLEPSSEIAAGCIIRTVQKGYRMNQRLIRAAKVIVAEKDKEAKAEPAEEETQETQK
ncbi:MAG: nucleotide exchange factor GrpE [Betaproteobacteria bacterium]|nr:nucleotide exchange factor GrpE [Betaproteobacteria bacterium]